MTINELKSLCQEGKKKLTDACVPDGEQSIALNLNELIRTLDGVKVYGKLYSVSPKVAIEQRNELEKKLYEDICKCLMENGVLILHSEGTPVDVTYGWKLKGVPYERPSEEHKKASEAAD